MWWSKTNLAAHYVLTKRFESHSFSVPQDAEAKRTPETVQGAGAEEGTPDQEAGHVREKEGQVVRESEEATRGKDITEAEAEAGAGAGHRKGEAEGNVDLAVEVEAGQEESDVTAPDLQAMTVVNQTEGKSNV